MLGFGVLLVPLMLWARITTALFASESIGNDVIAMSIVVCGMGLEISIFLKAALSITLLTLVLGKEFVFVSGFLSLLLDRKDAMRFRALLLVSFGGFFIVSSAKVTVLTTASGLDSGLLDSFGISSLLLSLGNSSTGAGLTGTLGALRRGDISSLAVHVEFSSIGDEMIGLAFDPGFGGGKAGATEAAFAEATAPEIALLVLTDCARFTIGLTNAVFSTVVWARLTTGVLAGTGGTTGTGGAVRIGSGSFFLMGVSVKPLKRPQNSSAWAEVGGASLWSRK